MLTGIIFNYLTSYNRENYINRDIPYQYKNRKLTVPAKRKYAMIEPNGGLRGSKATKWR